MPDRGKVINGLELCTNISPDGCLMLCPYKDEKDETYSGFYEQVLKQDALTLLKEQDAILLENQHKPYGIGTNANSPWISRCPRCGKKVEGKQTRFCKYCGKAVKWE